uniref:Uncharacterized protein n=1 Tax=Arundo donax TaxID=35708 RepID=A0A0A9A3B0_ARUDO
MPTTLSASIRTLILHLQGMISALSCWQSSSGGVSLMLEQMLSRWLRRGQEKGGLFFQG